MAERILKDSRIEPLTDENYPEWSWRMESALTHAGLWDAVRDGTDDAARDAAAKNAIITHLKAMHMVTAREAETAQGLWNTLRDLHDRATQVRVQSLRRELTRFAMQENETAKQYLTRAKELLEALHRAGDAYTETQMVDVVLDGFSDEFAPIVNAMQCSGEALGLNDVLMKVLAAEDRIKRRAGGNANAFLAKYAPDLKRKLDEHEAFIAKFGRGENGRFAQGGRGIHSQWKHGDADQRGKGAPGRGFEASQRGKGTRGFAPKGRGKQCYNCKGFGHIAVHCPTPPGMLAAFTEFEEYENNEVEKAGEPETDVELEEKL